MRGPVELRLSEVMGALSYALDLTDGQPAGHAVRSCMIGMRISEAYGLPPAGRTAVFYGLLMKDAGCSSNASHVAALYGTDDLLAKQQLRTVNYSRPGEALGYVFRTAGGVRDLTRIARAGKAAASRLTEIRCERGAEIARMLELPEGAAEGIRSLGEHWDGKGHPTGLRGEEIPLLARIFSIAQTVEVFVRDFGVEAACAMVIDRSGSWFDPELVEVVLSLRHDQSFWAGVEEGRHGIALETLEPEAPQMLADDARLDRVAQAFALVIDAKSPYTFRHSSRVAELALVTGRELGFDQLVLRDLRRAALLHDIGKLAVPNSILDKPGALTVAERRRVEQHPRLSADILGRVAPFRDIARLAGAHHEKLDGSGYWQGLQGEWLGLPERVLAVADIYEALTAERPYRAAMAPERALEILAELAGRELDRDAVSALAGSVLQAPALAA
jgi:putative nucleotidyltransferase with HDIG domain